MSGIAERLPAPTKKAGSGGAKEFARLATLAICVVVTLSVFALVMYRMVWPLPEPKLVLRSSVSRTVPGTLKLPWPTAGQAKVELEGVGVMGGSGSASPTPTASVAKVMTAFVFLSDHPLRGDGAGPTYTISAEEAARLPFRIAREETHVNVVAGEPFTERQALEALMIVSANNIAHELARWDAGGDAPFVAKMNATARRLGMTGTRYTDPSGFDPTTVSTAADQVRLFEAAMRIPAFAQVVSKPVYTPQDGGEPQSGGNTLLGSYGVIGGKTGFTSQAGANYVFAARSHNRLLVGAVMAQPNATSPAAAIAAAESLIVAAEHSLTEVTLAPRGARLAQVDSGLGHRVPVVTAAPVQVTGWPGLTLRLSVAGKPPRHAPTGRTVGAVTVADGRTALKLARPLHEPGMLDRLLHM